MSNMQRLAASPHESHRLFALTVDSLKDAQGFYSRLFRSVNALDEEDYEHLEDLLAEQNFRDTVDVVLWLEQ